MPVCCFTPSLRASFNTTNYWLQTNVTVLSVANCVTANGGVVGEQIKFVLEEDMKAQRGSRDIALLFL
jgi:hypothetical protein